MNELKIKAARQEGIAQGYSLAAYNYSASEAYNTMKENIKEINEENLEEMCEQVKTICWEADQTSRQFSPFEFLAHSFNQDENSEELWETYEEGISEGVEEFLKELTEQLTKESVDNSAEL